MVIARDLNPKYEACGGENTDRTSDLNSKPTFQMVNDKGRIDATLAKAIGLTERMTIKKEVL